MPTESAGMGAGMAQQGLVKVKAQSTDRLGWGQPWRALHLSAAEFLVYGQKIAL